MRLIESKNLTQIFTISQNYYLREIKVVFARVYPFSRSFSAFSVMKIVYGNNKIYT